MRRTSPRTSVTQSRVASSLFQRPALGLRKARKRADGEGSIRYSETKELWIGRLMVARRLDGKPDIREVSAKTQRACRERLDALKN